MSNYSILVIDDEPDNFEVIEALLTSPEYLLHYANRGREAIADLDKFDPDVILLDVMMPDLDGIEVCKRIKAMAQWQAVPIIMVTALTETEDLARCLAAGADDFVSKPINGVELRARVYSMLRIKKQHDRLHSLSRLQRNNIHALENNLNELRLDLGVSFPNELNAPLNSILENTGILQQNFARMTGAEVDIILESINRATLNLDKLNQSFLFYLQLALPTKETNKRESCNSQQIITETILSQVNRFPLSPKLVFDVEDTKLAVIPEHLKYIIIELLDRTLRSFNPESAITVCGHVIDGAFHFCMDNQAVDSLATLDSKLSESILFNDGASSEQELGIGLKIVKKIVEIYDGLFLIVSTNSQTDLLDRRDEIAIYITLPIVTSTNRSDRE